jgi:type II secretory pathway component PulC
MSFSKTISVFAALASIFGAGAAGWKLSQENQTKPVEAQQDISVFEQKINELEKKLEEAEKPQEQPVIVQQPQPQILPPLPPMPEPKPGEFE